MHLEEIEMSNDMIPVTVRIMEKEYKISCPEGEHEALIASAKHVNENMQLIREGGKALGAERIAVMAAINIAHELMKNGSSSEDTSEISSRLDNLQKLVDGYINDSAQ